MMVAHGGRQTVARHFFLFAKYSMIILLTFLIKTI